MADPENKEPGDQEDKNIDLGPAGEPEAEPGAEPGEEPAQAPEEQKEMFQDEDDFLTADHVRLIFKND